ncbi:MAG: FAD-binding protein, partial [Lachnospiraceae bacterium]|nr:FAD-binding protein [Lachnospiraceae bacterium]
MYTDFLKEIAFYMKQEDIKTDELMSKHTSFRVGGPAKVFLTVHSEEILKQIFFALKKYHLPYFVLGNGSNLLVSDEGYDGVMVYLGEEFSQVEVIGTTIRAKAAALLGKVARMAMEGE